MKCTFVSCMPRPINENMPHIRPSIYSLPPAKDKDFEILIIDDAIDDVYAGEGKHISRIELSASVAANLKNMICSSQLALGENACPGVFFVEGEFTKEEIKAKFGKELEKARIQQLNWYRNLVREADDVWVKFHQHRAISDLMRFAANALKLKREWLIDLLEEFSTCPACGANLISASVTICKECKTIIKPKEHAEKFGKSTIAA